MRVAMLTYSVRPRGGVVHAIEVAEALARRGHHVELMALGSPGEGFFRTAAVPATVIEHEPLDLPFDERIERMIETYRDGLAGLLPEGSYDVVHAQDCLSANAALMLRDLDLVEHVIRTVHHVDEFTSPSLVDCQVRSIVEPDGVLCVSDAWVDPLRSEFGVEPVRVGNGVDTARFRPSRDRRERDHDRQAAGVAGKLCVLAVGGIEPRKGSLTLLEAFARLRETLANLDPVLVVAGGATLFDYRHELEAFQRRTDELGIGPHVRRVGTLPQPDMERLYRAADVFAFPSVKEGFGLAVLEALASGLPVVASDLPALRGFLADERSALLVPAHDARALAAALARLAVDSQSRRRLRDGGRRVVAAHTWDAVAGAHEAAYRALLPVGDPAGA
jgi:glycosyltransferase-like protein